MIERLMDDIKAVLEAALAGEIVEEQGQPVRRGGVSLPKGQDASTFEPPQVFVGDLPSRTRGNETFPFALIYWWEGQDGEQERTEEIRIGLGVFGLDGEATERHAINLVAAVRSALLANARTLGRWALQLPIKSGKPPPKDQPHPYALAQVVTTWSTPAPEHIPEEDLYGQE